MSVPISYSVVLDCPEPLALAAFYATLLDWSSDPESDESWATITDGASGKIEFQGVADYQEPTWPEGPRPQMFHLDLAVEDLEAAHERAIKIGARLLDDNAKTFRVYADPAGHPFCLCAC